MKIKLKRALWNAKPGDVKDVTEEHAKWAVKKGLADFEKAEKADKTKVEVPEKNK